MFFIIMGLKICLRENSQYFGTQSFIIGAKGNYPARHHPFDFTDSILYIFGIDVITGYNNNVLFPSNDIIFIVIDESIIATIKPAVLQNIGSFFWIVPIAIKHRNGTDSYFTNSTDRQVFSAFIHYSYPATFNYFPRGNANPSSRGIFSCLDKSQG